MERKINKKNSNIELLRIIAMLLIIAHHYSLHGLSTVPLTYCVDRITYNWLVIGGKIGVNIFILISGYYMCKSKFSLKKFIKLYGQVAFYSVSIFLIFKYFITSNYNFDIYYFVKSLFPIINSKYWFITTYIYLMLLTPILNKILNNASKKELKNILLVSIIFCSLIPTFFNVYNPINELLWFMLLYLIGGYINIYKLNIDNKKALISSIIFYILTILINIMEDKSLSLSLITGLLFSIFIFVYFVNKTPKNNRIISLIGSSVFGIYLIHDNELVRAFIWNNIFHCPEYFGTGYLFIHALITITIIFIICSIIDILRINTLEKIWIKLTDKKIIPYINTKIDNIKKTYKIIQKRISKKEKIIQEKYLKIIIFVSISLSTLLIIYLTKDVVKYILASSNTNIEILFELISYSIKTLIYIFLPIVITLLIVSNKVYKDIKKHNKFSIIIRLTIFASLIYLLKKIKSISINSLIYSYYIENSNNSYIYFIILLLIMVMSFKINIKLSKKEAGELSAKKRKKL